MWAVPPQPCSQSGKRRWFSCTTAAPCGPFGAQPSASGNLIASRQAHFSTITMWWCVVCRMQCLRICGKCRACEVRAPYAVLFSTWALPTQPCSQSGKCRWFSCTTRSTITRLPSGSSTSHSGVFRDGALSVGVGTAHPCTGALAALCRIPAPPEPFLSA